MAEGHGKVEPGDPHEMGKMCPMKVPDLAVVAAVTDTTAATAAIEFSTTPDNVGDLQARVAHMAKMHGDKHGKTQGDADAGHGKAHHGEKMVEAEVQAENTDSGARLVFTARSSEDHDALAAKVQGMAEKMGRGSCPMHDKGQTHGDHPQDGGDKHH
jgi:hypothetical protein